MDKETLIQTSFIEDDSLYNKRIEPTTAPDTQIGIDTDNELLHELIDSIQTSQVDLAKLQSFSSVSRSRNELYDTLDYMAEDTTLASVLETYAEDATEMNDSGDIIWCESEDPAIGKYITFLLNSLNVNKHIFSWARSLCKYGDVYLRLYRESDIGDKFFSKKSKANKNTLNEDVTIKAYSKGDKYIHYLEQAPNPAQIFELTRFGKTAGYIKTKIQATSNTPNLNASNMFSTKYRFDSNDVELYPATEWVHGCLAGSDSRVPEEVELFTSSDDNAETSLYTVRKGTSLLYDSYKTWRELMLLENSVLLNRVTQSSIVRVIGVEVGDMPKENVQPHLMSIKHMIEQKAALNVGKNISEYTNPGPVVNNIYVPTRNNQGVISAQQIGGDVNIGELVDLNYYEDKLFGGLRVPKQYFGRTDDAAGFNGGSSLSIISSRYAKMIKRIQHVLIQMVTDAINLILIDTNNENYINKFTIRMLAPTTQEEIDRRDNVSNKIGVVSDLMNILTDIEDPTMKLKILKALLSDVVTNVDVISYIQEVIDAAEAEQEVEQTVEDDTDIDNEDLSSLFGDDTDDINMSSDMNIADTSEDNYAPDSAESSSEESVLPSPSELDIGDVSDSTNPNLA